jgi:hypothetical protein
LRFLLSILLLAGLWGSSAPQPRALTDDAYVWQRRWTRAVAEALSATAGRVRAWRVLAAQASAGGRLHATALDADAVRASARPVIAVVRIDGRLLAWDADALRADLHALLARWRALGLDLAGVEIDHDCGTAQLAGYATFLAQLRAELPAELALSITTLPAWLAAPALDGVLAAVDEAVLQVHAVEHPRAGLVDAARALAWAQRFDRRTAKPFRIALPTYGSRVAWDEDGRIRAVESEAPSLAPRSNATELAVAPADMAALRRALADAPLRRLAGIAWFRLPTETDRRAWSLAAFHAVLDGRAPTPDLVATSTPSATPGLRDLVLVNRGDGDADLPRVVRLPANCRSADGIGPYRLAPDTDGARLQRVGGGLLRGQRALTIGWMRCAAGELHAEP